MYQIYTRWSKHDLMQSRFPFSCQFFRFGTVQGVGKTMILGTFAEILGYRRITVFCFKDWEVDFVIEMQKVWNDFRFVDGHTHTQNRLIQTKPFSKLRFDQFWSITYLICYFQKFLHIFMLGFYAHFDPLWMESQSSRTSWLVTCYRDVARMPWDKPSGKTLPWSRRCLGNMG